MKLLLKLFLLISLTTTSLLAANVKLVHITNDEDDTYYHLGMVVDDNTMEIESVYKTEFNKSGGVLSKENYSVEQILNGVTLVKRSGRDVAKIKASNFNPTDGADIELDTLYSGVNGERKKYDASVERVGESWVFNFQNKRAQRLHFVSNTKFLIGTIGIKTIKITK